MIVGGVLALATMLALWRRQSWWVRIFDFPRLQIAGGLLLVLLGHLAVAGMSAWDMAFRALLVACLALQVRRILPYTRLARVQVLQSEQAQPRHPLRLMFANVLQPQHRSQKLWT